LRERALGGIYVMNDIFGISVIANFPCWQSACFLCLSNIILIIGMCI